MHRYFTAILLLLAVKLSPCVSSYSLVGNGHCLDNLNRRYTYFKFIPTANIADCVSSCDQMQTRIGFVFSPGGLCNCLFDIDNMLHVDHVVGEIDMRYHYVGNYPIVRTDGLQSFSEKCYKFNNVNFDNIPADNSRFFGRGNCLDGTSNRFNYAGVNGVQTHYTCRQICFNLENKISVGYEFNTLELKCRCLMSASLTKIPNFSFDTLETLRSGEAPIISYKWQGSQNELCYAFQNYNVTFNPTSLPTASPVGSPSISPTFSPSNLPSKSPSKSPTVDQNTPTLPPVGNSGTAAPTVEPSSNSGVVAGVVVTVLLLLGGGGGFSYWWFKIRKKSGYENDFNFDFD